MSKYRIHVAMLILAVVSFLLLNLLYPFGLQAVLVNVVRDVTVEPDELVLYASRSRIFCYDEVIKVRNLGVAGLTYELTASLEGQPSYLHLSYGGEVVLGSGFFGRLRLGPGVSASLSVCLRAPSPAELVLHLVDPRYGEATKVTTRIRVVETDWWDNRFPRRLSLTITVEREGFVLFEVLGSGEVYANGRLVGRVHALAGIHAETLSVVYMKGDAGFLLPFQVEAWEQRPDGLIEPKGLRTGRISSYDRLVFAAQVANGTRIDVYIGGKLEEKFEAAGRIERNVIEVSGLRVELDEYGFRAPELYVNLSGRIIFPYVARPELYSDWGNWKTVVVGPVRAVAVFNTTGLSGYLMEAHLMVWGLNLNVTQLTVWPKTIRRGIVLDWAAPLLRAGNVTVDLVCGTTCELLPLRLEPWGVKLCENYWQPGDHSFGYFTLLFRWSELGSVRGVRSRLSTFPGG